MKQTISLIILLCACFLFGNMLKSFVDYSAKSQASVYREKSKPNFLTTIPTENSIK